jgi:hypothetical protein
LNDLTVSKQFEIINLNDALKLINDNKTFIDEKTQDTNELSKSDQYMPRKYLELIVTSPVFCNPKLIPSCKYKFQSQFTKALFTDAELK